ncbi:MAG: 3-hydroxyacyl-CoA dehydrogenase family protein [Dehalococcoidia bacterium]|nr:3-hydroxyacyl-CoA dehydrogenase family protein [Dehalococcoidia bacterium]
MKIEDISHIAVLGTGTMAPAIALLCSKLGYNVSIWGRSDTSLQRAFDRLKSHLQTYRENNLIQEEQTELILSRIAGVSTLEEAVRGADFVIEAVAEDLNLKKNIFSVVDRVCQETTIIATNTSGLSITELASATNRPEKVVGTHFWNPPHMIPLVEIVRGEKTSEETIGIAVELMTAIGKTPVIVQKDIPGFIGNRLQFALLREALHIVEQGVASIEDVDTTVKMSFGARLPITGPLESADLGGLDVYVAISKYLMPDLCQSTEVPALLVDAVKSGRLGVKSGAGLYEWTPAAISRIIKAREQELMRFFDTDRTGSTPPNAIEKG